MARLSTNTSRNGTETSTHGGRCILVLDRVLLLLVLVTFLNVVSSAGADDSKKDVASPPGPLIDLKRLEPQVASQLESVQSLLLEIASKPDSTNQQRADAYGEFGRLLHAYQYTNEAAECYRHSTVNQPSEARWWHLLGSALEAAGRLTEAEPAFRRAHQLRGDYLATQVRLGNTLAQLNRTAEAKRVFHDLLVADPKLAAAHASAGTLALEERDFDSAVKHLSKALELAPAATRLHYSLAMAYRGGGDLNRARQHLRLRGDVGLRPDDPLVDELPLLLKGAQVHLLRGNVALAAGALPDAVREYRLAVKDSPDGVTARVNMAVALVRMQNRDEAIQQLQLALQSEPENSTALYNLASLYQSGDQVRQAVELLRRLIEVEPRDLPARQLLARSLVTLRQPDDAVQVLREAIRLDPDDETTTLQLADLLAGHQQHAQARTLLEDAAAKHPERGLTMHALARHLASSPDAKTRDGVRALRLAKIVYEARPTFDHLETLAMASAAAGEFEMAIRLQKQLLEAAEQQRADQVANRIKQNLARYEQRETAR
jgi:tetratricopeptide (TPR) repeat protein